MPDDSDGAGAAEPPGARWAQPDVYSVDISLPGGRTATEYTDASGRLIGAVLKDRKGDVVREWDEDSLDGMFESEEEPDRGRARPWLRPTEAPHFFDRIMEVFEGLKWKWRVVIPIVALVGGAVVIVGQIVISGNDETSVVEQEDLTPDADDIEDATPDEEAVDDETPEPDAEAPPPEEEEEIIGKSIPDGFLTMTAQASDPCEDEDYEVFLRATNFLNGQSQIEQLFTSNGNAFSTAMGSWTPRLAYAVEQGPDFFNIWVIGVRPDELVLRNVYGSGTLGSTDGMDHSELEGAETAEAVAALFGVGDIGCAVEFGGLEYESTPFPAPVEASD